MAHFQKDGLWIQGGQGALANVSETTPFVEGQLGKVLSIKDAAGLSPAFYQYVYRDDNDAETTYAGAVAYWHDLDNFVVTAESTDAFGTATDPVVAGVFLGAYPAAAKYGFIGVGGQVEVGVTDTVVVGDRLCLADNTHMKAYSYAITITSQAVSVPTAPVYGIAVDAITTATGTAITAFLSVLHNGW